MPLGRTDQLFKEGFKQDRNSFYLRIMLSISIMGPTGATFRVAMEAQDWYRQRLEAQPVRFMEDEALPAVLTALTAVGQLVGADFRDLAAVTNATSAINLVVQSLHLRRGDLLLMTNLTYPAVKHTLARAAGAAGAGLLEVQLTREVLTADSSEPLISLFKEALSKGTKQGRRIRLAVIDHIASNPPYHFPVGQLCSLCRAADAQVLVDGAHAVGAVPLEISSLGADYYTSNLHKWACSPKGAAFLWVHRSRQASLRPLVTSHGYGLGFWAEMLWAGTSDATAMMAVPASLAVLRNIGLERIRQYNHSLLLEAVALLTGAWATSTVIGADKEWACMASVQLPDLGAAFPVSIESALRLHDCLRKDFNIEVPCSCYGGSLWVRISAQYYNTRADYQALADAILTFGRDAAVKPPS
eukprot:jgi/Botrbrau1/7514/Bobra.0019s0005.1